MHHVVYTGTFLCIYFVYCVYMMQCLMLPFIALHNLWQLDNSCFDLCIQSCFANTAQYYTIIVTIIELFLNFGMHNSCDVNNIAKLKRTVQFVLGNSLHPNTPWQALIKSGVSASVAV